MQFFSKVGTFLFKLFRNVTFAEPNALLALTLIFIQISALPSSTGTRSFTHTELVKFQEDLGLSFRSCVRAKETTSGGYLVDRYYPFNLFICWLWWIARVTISIAILHVLATLICK